MKTKFVKTYRFHKALFLALVISLGFIANTANVLAIPDEDFYSGNNILFYDPDSGTCTSTSAVLRGASTKEKIWNYLVDKGLTAEQAAGVMGNIEAESGYVPTRHQGTGEIWNNQYTSNAWGLAQWDGGRRFNPPNGGILGKLREKKPLLEKYTAIEFDTARNPGAQIPAQELDELTLFELDYLYDESTHRRVTETRYGNAENEWATLKLQKTIEDATVFWHNNFEVSADTPEKVLGTRGGFAQKAFAEFSTKTGSTGAARCSNATGTFNSKLLEYAWPTYHAQPYITAQPGWTAAVARADTEKRYVGGDQHHGIDCGGFVTTLLIDSGFEPNYNYAGKISEGAGFTGVQIQWLDKNWQKLGSAASIDTGKLQAGDVAISSEHTFVFVGDVPKTGSDPKFETNRASASLDQRAPMAGRESLTDPTMTWYRKK